MDNTQQTRRRKKGGFKCIVAKPVKTQQALFVEEQKRVREKWNNKEGSLYKVNFYKFFVLSSDSYNECINRFKARLQVVQERIMHFLGVRFKEDKTLISVRSLPFYCADSEEFGEFIRVYEMKYFKKYRILNILEEEEKDLYNYMNAFIKYCNA